MDVFSTGLTFTPEVFILCKKEKGTKGPVAMNFKRPFGSLATG